MASESLGPNPLHWFRIARGSTRGIRIRDAIRQRTCRPHRAYLAVPLAMIAAAFTAPVVAAPCVVLGWWWAPTDTGWEWLVVLGRALLGIEWALVGVNLIVLYPAYEIQAGIIWVFAALMLVMFADTQARPRGDAV